MTSTQKPWEHAKAGGSQQDELAARFVESLSYDTRLYKHDIVGSLAHARMLSSTGLITAEDLREIERGLGEIRSEIEAGGVAGWEGWKVELEDVHMCIEAALIEKIGEPGRKLHTGRSRNDQVALDLKLWLNEATAGLEPLFTKLFKALVELAERDGDVVMPSYTHLQRAQPIAVGGEVVAWLTAFDRCLARLMMLRIVDSGNPLGSGAIAGSGLPLDRHQVAESLDVGEPTPSSIDATASRDGAIDFVYALSMTGLWLSRWAEQWIIYLTSEFSFLQIGESFTTGSSMMPQKRNPDMLELTRGRAGGLFGNLVALLTTCKGLTIGYNRDLQEDKRHVFMAYDALRDCLDMAARIVKSAKFNRQKLEADVDRGFADATSLADYLVTRGVPFRTAHQHVGKIVRRCEAIGLASLSKMPLAEMQAICEAIEPDVREWLGPANVVARYRTYGNAGLRGYRQQLAQWKQRLDSAAVSGAPAAGLFGDALPLGDGDQALIDAYVHHNRTLDDLPYTGEFEAIFAAAGDGRSRRDVLSRLLNMRKAGRLPRIGKAKEAAPLVTDEQEAALSSLVAEQCGGLSMRDQLPYTDRFDSVVINFNARTGVRFSPYQVWRVVARLAK
jgi:argininosuccinate lyase